MRLPTLLGAFCVPLLVACNGLIGDPGVTPGEDPSRRGPGDGPSLCELQIPDGALSRLTRAQYDNTVRDLLGTTGNPAEGFPADDNTQGFEVGLTVPAVLAEQYFDTAETLAEAAVADLESLLPCDPATGEDACAAEFVDEFGMKAFRRPLTEDERTRLMGLFTTGRDAYDFSTGIQMVVHAALTSSHFIYHVELSPEATPGEIARVKGYEMASRLSYFLWNTMPDDALFAAAAAGELDTAEGVEAQARRMVMDPRMGDGLGNFTRQWLHLDGFATLDKDTALFPDWDGALADDLRASVEEYIRYVVLEGDGSVEGLLTGRVAFVNDRIAPIYGLTGSYGPELELVELPAGERQGLLTQPGLLALLAKTNQSNPIHRGKFVRERLFCQNLPPPPEDLVITAPDPAPGLSTRERFAEHSSNPGCVECHQLMDPIGFGFESFDALGRFRAEDDGRPVDATGEILGTDDADGPFDGVPELADRLAGSQQVHECVTRQFFRYSVQRVETSQEQCGLDELFDVAADTDWNIREMLVHITQTDGFAYRHVLEGL